MRDIAGKNVVVTGTITGESRLSASAKLRDAGALVQSAVGPTTDMLVTGDRVGKRKIEEAHARGIEIVPWLDLHLAGLRAHVPVVVIDGQSEPHEGILTEDEHGDKIVRVRDVGPMLCKPAEELPVGDDWVYEVKWDGLRCIARVYDSHVVSSTNARVIMRSRSGKSDYVGQFPYIAEQLVQMGTDLVLDGELVVLDGGAYRSYVVWDVLEMNNVDLRGLMLEQRKDALAELAVQGFGEWLVLQPFFDEPGPLWAEVEKRGLEGVVAKRRGSRYVEGSRDSWVKVKLRNGQEFVVVGYVPGKGALTGLAGGVVLAYRDQTRDAWVYVGRAGSGPTDADRRALTARLDGLEAAERHPELDVVGATKADLREVVWVEPRVIANVQFQKWTEDGRLVHPSLKGVREDKDPHDVVREL